VGSLLSAQMRERIDPVEIRGIKKKEVTALPAPSSQLPYCFAARIRRAALGVTVVSAPPLKGLGAAGFEPRGAACWSFAALSGPAPGCQGRPAVGHPSVCNALPGPTSARALGRARR
jgi:hypothetical protein